MKYIICDFARSNWGKTKTLLEVIEQLKPIALLVDEKPIAPNDKFAIFEMNGKKIVVNTQGDPNSYQEEGLKRAVKEDAYIIVCASRTKGATEECIYKIAKNGYEIIWFSNFFADNDSLSCVNLFPEITAKSIVNLIQKIIL